MKLNLGSKPNLLSSIDSQQACDTHGITMVLLQPTQPRWTRIDRPKQQASAPLAQVSSSCGKRTLTLSEDHFKLPNKHQQVSRSAEKEITELVEADI